MLLCLVIGFSSLCFGQGQQDKSKWIHVTDQQNKDEYVRWYINSNRVVVNAKKRIIRVWVKMTIDDFDFSGLKDDEGDVRLAAADKPLDKKETLALHEFNCTENTSKTLKLIDYKNGKVVDDYNLHTTDYIIPDTVMEQVFKQACKRVRR